MHAGYVRVHSRFCVLKKRGFSNILDESAACTYGKECTEMIRVSRFDYGGEATWKRNMM